MSLLILNRTPHVFNIIFLDRCYPAGTILVGGERADELYARTMKRIDLIKSKHPDVEVVWECQIKEELKTTEGMQKFFDEQEVSCMVDENKHCMNILRIIQFTDHRTSQDERCSVWRACGGTKGIFEVDYEYRHKILRHMQSLSIDAEFKAGVLPCYPHLFHIKNIRPSYIFREYPLGHPEVITSNFKEVTGTSFPYRGIVKLRILPPQNLEVAALPYRYEGALYFTLCSGCVPTKLV